MLDNLLGDLRVVGGNYSGRIMWDVLVTRDMCPYIILMLYIYILIYLMML